MLLVKLPFKKISTEAEVWCLGVDLFRTNMQLSLAHADTYEVGRDENGWWSTSHVFRMQASAKI